MEGASEDVKSEAGDAEDIPSDFFDDFNKDEFMAGLSVIDECGDDAALSQNNIKSKDNGHRKSASPQTSDKDNFIKPGSRRDLTKTNEAIKKDKEVKVLQFLAKSLSASDDLHPPGTELDYYFDEDKETDTRRMKSFEDLSLKLQNRNTKKQSARQSWISSRHSPEVQSRRSPHSRRSQSRISSRHSPHVQSRRSPHSRRSPQSRRSPRQRPSPCRSPFRKNHPNIRRTILQRRSPRKYSPNDRTPRRLSPIRRSPRRYSPTRHGPRRHSPRRRSPHRKGSRSPHRKVSRSPHRKVSRSPHRQVSKSPHRSRSPLHQLSLWRQPSALAHCDDNFLYPDKTNMYCYQINPSYQSEYGHQYNSLKPPEGPGSGPTYNYSQISAPTFSETYNYGELPIPAENTPAPVPALVPAPTTTITKATPYDALAQLVAEGKISQEDYLKLTPNKGVVTAMDPSTRFTVLSRCHEAISKLDKLLLPNHLRINNQVGLEEKYLAPKYCSPLKRQIITEFSFSKGSISQEQQNKKLVDSIIATLGLEKIVTNYKKKLGKNMKDASMQTTKQHCEVCQIRESTKYHDVGTSTEPEYFTSTVHTQVVEQDLVSSKAIFNPSGSVGEGAAISIAHMTPAQLVSQLAARAKTLKQPQDLPSSNPYNRRPNYDFDGRGDQQYHHSYNNYRY